MFSKRVRALSVGLLALAIPLVLIAAACEDGGEEATTVPDDTATADAGEASPTATANSAIGAVAVYVTETGLDGEIFDVTEPINCNAFVDIPEEQQPRGKICIYFNNSEFTETSGVMEIRAYGTGATWDLTLELQDLSWVVTGAEETTPETD
jgi:hypothetical protein